MNCLELSWILSGFTETIQLLVFVKRQVYTLPVAAFRCLKIQLFAAAASRPYVPWSHGVRRLCCGAGPILRMGGSFEMKTDPNLHLAFLVWCIYKPMLNLPLIKSNSFAV